MKKHSLELIGLSITLPVAACLWYGVFIFESGNFWLKISCAAMLLAVAAFTFSHKTLKTQFVFMKSHLVTGILSALVLYAIFWFGKSVLIFLFHSAKTSISSVYAPQKSLPAWGIAILLFFVTSPAEEIFWRGFVQRVFMQKCSPVTGFFLAVCCYAGVHLWTLNIPLILAALIAGIFWGLLYIQQKSLIPVMISHAVWSVLVFLVFPFA